MFKTTIIKNIYLRILFLFIIFLLLVYLIVKGLVAIKHQLFNYNKHFILKEIVVKSTGYWDNKADEIKKITGLELNKTNLFNIDLKKIRSILLNEKKFGIYDVYIDLDLPNSIYFQIFPRLPIAILFSKKSNFIIDKDGYVINKKYCNSIAKNLPVITGIKLKQKNYINYGAKINIIKPALIFFQLVNLYFPELDIKIVNLYIKDELNVFLKAPNKKIVKVILPFPYSEDNPPNEDQINSIKKILYKKLNELKEVFRYLSWKNHKDYYEINMLYNEQAVVK